MASETSTEHFSVCIDASVTSKDLLFSCVTDTAYLGYSTFSGWDGFSDMFWNRLVGHDIVIEIDNQDLSGLPRQDRLHWIELLDDLRTEFPGKLRVANAA